MRLKKYILNPKIQKYLIFVSYLILLACTESNKNRESTPDISFTDQNYSTIDSLLSRISNDTVALFSYLSLVQSTQDRYAEMKTYRQLGLYYLDNYAFLKAIEYHTYFLDIAEKDGDLMREVEALNTLAYDYKKICALDKSSEHYFKALSLLNKLAESDNKKAQSEKAKTLNGLGNIYLKINQPDEAISYLQKSLRIETQNNNILGQAKNLADIGSFFENRIEYDSAHQYFDRSLKLYIKANSVSGINFCYERMGNLYMMEGDYHSASVYIESAYNSLQHTSDRLNWLNCCFTFANICIKKGEYRNAETFLHEGLKVSEELKLPNYLEKAFMLLSELYKHQGNTVAALEAYTMSVSYAKERNISQIIAHRLAYEKKSDEKEKILLTAQLENIERKKTKAIHIIIVIFIALTGFIIIFIQLYQLKKQKVESSLHLEKIKSDFYINISHEFKTPVTIITGLIERLRNNLDTNDLHRNSTDLDILSRQSQNLLLLIDAISSATNKQKNRSPGSIMHDNIATYISCLFESFSVLAESKKINYSFHDEFIKQLVEKLNGTIEIEGKSPKETIFRISLPVFNEQTDDNRHSLIIHNTLTYGKDPENNTEIQPLPEKENPTVLIVENNNDMIYYLSSILKENYHISTVNNGRKAAQKAAETMPDIIISNIILPGMNGYDLCKEIKNSDATSHIPIILLSAYGSIEERIKGFRCRADAFLSKPVHEEELLAVVDQLLDVRKQISSKYALTTINTGRNNEHGIVKNNVSLEFIKQITDLIYQEIDNTENIIDVLSDKTCLSSSQLNRKIKAAAGMTTSNYILKVRLNKAGQLLTQSQKPIGEIAMNCGFNDFAYFSRSFRKKFGMTPTSFQRLPHSVN